MFNRLKHNNRLAFNVTTKPLFCNRE